jgi:predicted permease
MGVPLLAGRDFDERDTGDRRTVAIVNRRFAEHFFGNKSPIGRHVGFGVGPQSKLDIEIVGMVENSLYEGPRQGVRRQVFVPLLQGQFPNSAAFYVRTSIDSTQMFRAVRAQVAQLDPGIPVYEMKTLDRQLDETLFNERLIATLSGAFGLLATLLAAIGLYGVMAFVVARRVKEIGLRMALGARQITVVWLILRGVLVLLVAGLAIGVPAAYGLSRYVSAQLFGIQPADVLTAAGAAAVLSVAAIAAGILPARRASGIDPLEALRYE